MREADTTPAKMGRPRPFGQFDWRRWLARVDTMCQVTSPAVGRATDRSRNMHFS